MVIGPARARPFDLVIDAFDFIPGIEPPVYAIACHCLQAEVCRP